MQTFRVPAAYARFIADRLAAAVREVHLDVMYRADDDAAIRAWRHVPDALVDPNVPASHTLLVVAGLEQPATPPTPVPCPNRPTPSPTRSAP